VMGCSASGQGSSSSQPSVAAAAPATTAPTAAPTADPLTLASFRGTYQVIRTVISEKDFAFLYKVGQVENRTYAVTPSCPTGPCDVSIDVTGSKSGKKSTLPFKWVDGAYRYDLVEPTTQFQCTKNGKVYKTLDETTSAVLEPTLTALVDGKLVGTDMKFTEHYSVAPTGAAKTAGCTPFSVEMTGTVKRAAPGASPAASASPSK
jgi:hypothetical protein